MGNFSESSLGELYPLLDMHGAHVQFIDQAEVSRLKGQGVVVSYGTRKRIHGYRLTVSLSRIAGYEYSSRSFMPANFAGTRFIFRDKISTELANFYEYRYKNLEISESPEHALLRILTPVALEAAYYRRRDQATEFELAVDPGVETRRKTREVFRLGVVTNRRGKRPTTQNAPSNEGEKRVVSRQTAREERRFGRPVPPVAAKKAKIYQFPVRPIQPAQLPAQVAA